MSVPELWEKMFPYLQLSKQSSQIADDLATDRGIIDIALEEMEKANLLKLLKLRIQGAFPGYSISEIYFTNEETFAIRYQRHMENKSSQSTGAHINYISGGNFVNSPPGGQNTGVASNFTQNSGQVISPDALSDILTAIKSLRTFADSLSDDYRDDAIEVVDSVLEDFSSNEIDIRKAKKSSRSLTGFILPLGLSFLAAAPNAILDYSDRTVKFISNSVDLIEKIDDVGVDVKKLLPDGFREKYSKNP